MERQKNGQNVAIIALAIALVVMTVGFAVTVYDQTLAYEGTTHIGNAKWDVYFDTASYQPLTGSVTPSTNPNITGTKVSYDITLEKPGDFYEFTIDVENAGTFDAALKTVDMAITKNDSSNTDMTDTVKDYLSYTVTYDGKTYKASDSSVQGVILEKATDGTPTAEQLTIRVEYLTPDASLLPEDAVSLKLTAALYFEQA